MTSQHLTHAARDVWWMSAGASAAKGEAQPAFAAAAFVIWTMVAKRLGA